MGTNAVSFPTLSSYGFPIRNITITIVSVDEARSWTMSLITRARSLYEHTASAPSITINVEATGIRKWDRKTQQEGEQIKNPARTVAVIERLQTSTAPQEFNPRGVFDGVVNFFTLKNMSQSMVLVCSSQGRPFADSSVDVRGQHVRCRIH
jgi:hypothetical protein